MKIVPIHNRVVIRRKMPAETSKGGIIIPDSAKETVFEGEVLAVGPGRVLNDGTFLTPTVKSGDHVLFEKYQYAEATIDGEKYLVAREDNILGVLKS